MSSKLLVPVAEMLRRPGASRELSMQVEVDGLATSDAAVHGPVDLQLHLESVVSGLEVTGSLAAGWRGSCRRCLEPIEQTVQQDLREIFGSAPADDETYPIHDGEVDLTPRWSATALFSLCPIAPLCSEDCAGPAPDDYPMNQPEPSPEDRPRDPRWAALDALRTGQ